MDAKPKMKCSNCGGEEFEAQDGHYFCEECHVQLENFVEMEYDERFEEKKSSHRVKFSKTKVDNSRARRLTSFEEYNHILIGFIDEILNIELVPNFKLTCLQLWISYLRKIEAAFFDKEQVTAPKLFATYRKADSEILYNKKPKQKVAYKAKTEKIEDLNVEGSDRRRQKQMRKSEKIISQQLSESLKSESFNSSMLANLSIETIMSDHENVEMDVQFSKAGNALRRKGTKRTIKTKEPGVKSNDAKVLFHMLSAKERIHVLRGRTLLCIIYCALNICGSKIQLTDLLRFVIEGRISFYNTRMHLPEDFLEMDIPLSHEEHQTYRIVTYESLRLEICYFVKEIPDMASSMVKPNLLELCNRYLTEMGLPRDLLQSIERLMNFLPPIMIYNERIFFVPNYEGRAMAFIIFVLKLIFGLDGYREKEMTMSAKNINKALKHRDGYQKIFAYMDWMEFIEYRQEIIGRHYYPTLFSHDVKCGKPYVAFKSMINTINQKTRKAESLKVSGKDKQRMTGKMNTHELLNKLSKNHESDEPCTMFPSLTPLHDKFEQVLNSDSTEINSRIASRDFSDTTYEYFIEPKKLIDTCREAGYQMTTIKSAFPKCYVFERHEKIQRPFYDKLFEFSLNKMTEEKWRADVKQRSLMEKKVDAKDAIFYHEKTSKFVLSKRKIWRQLINEKKKEEKLIQSEAEQSENDEPQTFREETIFNDLNFEDVNENDDEIKVDLSMEAQLEEIFKNTERRAKIKDKTSLTFVVPDFNLWHRMIRIREQYPSNREDEIESLPKNFVWLLKFCASVLHQNPVLLYYQLLCIEHQFVNVYVPVELMGNSLQQQIHHAMPKKYLKSTKMPW